MTMARVKDLHDAVKRGDTVREPSQRNRHGLTPLGCAVGGTEGRWQPFSNATVEDWRRAADVIRAYGGVE